MARIDLRAARAASCFLIAMALGSSPARAFPDFATQSPFPNFYSAGGCEGLCHVDGFPGTAQTNPLNVDFEAAGSVWNTTMANADSDGDGFSNGWELQDPSGTWVAATPNPGSAALVRNPTLSNSRPPLPVASVPTAIFHTEAAGQNGSASFAIENVGAVSFNYTLTPSDVWMTPDPPPAQALPASEQDVLLLNFATGGLAAGLYQGDLEIAILGIRADRIPLVPVDLTVPEPSVLLASGGALLSLGLLARRRTSGICVVGISNERRTT